MKKLSVCIPNYNYEKYLPITLKSVLSQPIELEVVVADNASTDGSVKVIESFKDARVRVQVNAANVGFAGNLDRAARMATGDVLLMLSSDDMVNEGTLPLYAQMFDRIEPDAVLSSAATIIDSNGLPTGQLKADPTLWRPEDEVHGYPAPAGAKVYRVAAHELLKRCLHSLRNPFTFLATAYPKALYAAVEGYGGNRLMNPDKWFHWKLLGAASWAYFIDAPLFSYRWHATNQTAQQAQSGALKYLVDEYVSTFELDAKLLEKLGLSRPDVERAFVEHDIARHGLAVLAKGQAEKSRRILLFGASAYPTHALKNWKWWALGGLLATGPLGRYVAKASYRLLKSSGDDGPTR